MVKSATILEQWERRYLRSETLDLRKRFQILDALYAHARALGIFPLRDPLEGIETTIRLARALNVSGSTRNDRDNA